MVMSMLYDIVSEADNLEFYVEVFVEFLRGMI